MTLGFLLLIPALMAGCLLGLLLLIFQLPRLVHACFVIVFWVFAVLTVFYLLANHFTANGITEAVVIHLVHVVDARVLQQFWREVAVAGVVAALGLGRNLLSPAPAVSEYMREKGLFVH